MTIMNRRGSTLVLVLVAVLILSLIAVSALTQSNTEIGTARNFYQDKNAFYAADAGIQDGINQIKHSGMNPAGVSFSSTFGTQTYYSGTLSDTTPQNVKAFLGFKPPPPVGQSIEMGGELGMTTAGWHLQVSAGRAIGTRNQVRKQLQTVVVTMVAEY
ncbi:MAG: hypothetical protein JXO51_04510 [Candidatus Aminicenantes bacterium]|nr:hypothetical protein [Candidatus Aminicenantes bacterium]